MLNFAYRMLWFVAALALALNLMAQEEKSAHHGGILHPEMTVAPDAGSYDKPAATLGEKPAEPWTATTIAAGVDKKPLAGKAVTEIGEIIDLS